MKNEVPMSDSRPGSFSIKARLKSFAHAFRGVAVFFSSQHNAIIHLLMTIVAFGAAVFFDVSKVELIAITLATGLVWSAELFNTAIEKLSDIVSKDFHPGIKMVKDLSAAAVFLSALAAFLTGAIIFLPKLLS